MYAIHGLNIHCSLKAPSKCGDGGQNVPSKDRRGDEEPLIARGQLAGQLEVTSPP